MSQQATVSACLDSLLTVSKSWEPRSRSWNCKAEKERSRLLWQTGAVVEGTGVMKIFRLSHRLRESSDARDSVQRFSIRNPPIGNDSRETLLTFENMSISARIEKKVRNKVNPLQLLFFVLWSIYFFLLTISYMYSIWHAHKHRKFSYVLHFKLYYVFLYVGGLEIITIGASLKLVFVGHVNANWIVIFDNSHVFSGYSSCGKYGFVQEVIVT